MRQCFFLFVSMTIAHTVITQDVVYPKIEDAPYLSGNNPVITERIPVYIPERCPENMLLYPGQGDKSSWICDCKPGFLYFPLNNTCYEAYRQGPCKEGSYVYLPKGEVVPVCTENPCSQDNRVPYNGKCYILGSSDESPCGNRSSIYVNKTTFQLECTEIPLLPTQLLITAPKLTLNPCPPNGHQIKGVCRYPL